ncbi:MAG: CHAT domain-containing protein [Bacteroidota bacterium]
MEAIKTEAKALLSKNKLEKAIEYLISNASVFSSDAQDEIKLLSGRHKQIKKDKRRQLISGEEAEVALTKIRYSIIDLVNELGEASDEALSDPTGSQEQTSPPAKQKTKILFLASNPSSTGRLKLDKEIREIEEGLRRANHRDSFELVQKWAVRPADLRRAMLDENPQIVHFSGHGVTTGLTEEAEEGSRNLIFEEDATNLNDYDGGIVVEDDQGNMKILPAATLASLFKLFEGSVRCVLLNACYSQSQAKELKPHVPYIIGMNKAVPDNAAIVFATGFYDALGAGKDIAEAFEHGKVAVEFEGIAGADIMVLDSQ